MTDPRSPGRSHVRDIKRVELDRDTWAGLQEIRYDISVEGRGEAIGGPFWFGQAFDAAPFFTFSAVANNYDVTAAPQFTVGVAEWLLDEQKMYVGVMLWFAWDTCWEVFKGGLVYHEDFENILTRQGGGPEGDEIPSMNSTVGREIGWPSLNQNLSGQALDAPLETWAVLRHENGGWPDGQDFIDLKKRGALTYSTVQGHVVTENVSTEAAQGTNWHISTANPRPNTGGKYHLRRVHDGYSENISDRPPLQGVYVGNTLPCRLVDNETSIEVPNRPFPWDVKSITILPFFPVREGMIVTVEFDAMLSTVYGNDQAHIVVSFYDEDANFIGNESKVVDDGVEAEFGQFLEEHWTTYRQVVPLTDWGGLDPDSETNWPQYVGEVDSTQDIRYAAVYLNCVYDSLEGNLPYPAKTWDIDNIKVWIDGDIPELKTPSFLVNLSFTGQVLKGYSSVHPLRSYEHPPKVVLS